jgi:two-component system, NarL family, sensor histidine kinase UhpB
MCGSERNGTGARAHDFVHEHPAGDSMRNHPGRAMYDDLEDALSSITMQLRSAIQADTRRVNGASDALHGDSAWTRQITAELGSILLGTLGLAATIEWHVRQFQKCTGILYQLTVNDAAGCELPRDHATTVFDVYNEALSNVARHAAANRVAIALTITPTEVTMAVRDDGIGLAPGG